MGSQGLSSGDTLAIQSGTYSGATFRSLTGITIIPTGVGVTFTGAINVGMTNNVKFDGTVLSGVTYGYIFTGTSSHYCFEPSGGTNNNQNLTIKGFLFDHSGTVIDGDPTSPSRIVYNGTPATTLFYNLTLDTLKLLGAPHIYGGTFQLNTSYQNVNIGMNMRNLIFVNDGSYDNIKIRSHSLFNFLIDNWSVTGPSINNLDSGLMYNEGGNGTIRNIYRYGGWGYIVRLWNVSMNTIGDSYLYNIIDISSTAYGTIDSRVDIASINESGSIPLLGGNMHIFNVTCGDKYDTNNGYVTALLILGAMTGNDGHHYTTEMRNCFAFYNINSNPSSILLNNSSGTALLSMSNNLDIPGGVWKTNYHGGALPAGYVTDMHKFYPSPGGPLIAQGTTIAQTATDIYGSPRTGAYDIGAVQHDSIVPTAAITSPTSASSFSTTGTTVNLSGTAADNDFVASVTWSNNKGGSGTGTANTTWTTVGVPVSSTTWSINGIPLVQGNTNVITVTAHDASGNLGTTTVSVVAGSLTPPTLLSAVSQKTHGSAGTYGLPIAVSNSSTPAAGSPPVESRQGNLQLVASFNKPLTSASATIQSGSATLATPTVSGSKVTLSLSNVTNAQTLVVNLTNVTAIDGGIMTAGTVSLRVLNGDLNGDGVVGISDINLCRAASGQTTDATNYMNDVDCNGVIAISDINITRSLSGTQAP